MYRTLGVVLIAIGLLFILLGARLVTQSNSQEQYVCEPILSLAPGGEDYEVGLNVEGVAYGPSRIAVDTLNNIYILDCLNSRIQKFSLQGMLVNSISDTRIRTATDMFVLPSGVIYVLDDAHRRITSYDQDGKAIGSTYFIKEGKTFLFDRIRITGSEEILIGNIGQLHRVIKETSSGSREDPYHIEEVIIQDKKETEPKETVGFLIGTDKRGNNYYACWFPNPKDPEKYQRIVNKYNPEGNLLASIEKFPYGYYSYGVGERDLTVDQNGNIFYLYTSEDGAIQIIQCSK